MHLSCCAVGLYMLGLLRVSTFAQKLKPERRLDTVLGKCSQSIYDLFLIIHADILHSATFSNPSLPKQIVDHYK